MAELIQPVRMRLSRAKSFNLQDASRALNGLPALKVTRPGPWGNPFTVTTALAPGNAIRAPLSGSYIAVPTVEDAVACYAEMMAEPAEEGQRAYELRRRLPDLSGHNLACFCRLDAPCHADLLLRLANPIRCEAMEASDAS